MGRTKLLTLYKYPFKIRPEGALLFHVLLYGNGPVLGLLPHGFAVHVDAKRVAHEAIKDRIRVGRILDVPCPGLYGKNAGHKNTANATAILYYFE